MLAEPARRLVARPDLAGDRLVAVDDLASSCALDLGEIVGRERLVAHEVVIEAVLDRRAEGDLGAGIELLHRLGQHMGAVVAQQLQRVRVRAGDDLDLGVLARSGARDPRSSPSTLIASAALASPGPMSAASASPVTGESKRRTLPSGKVMATMGTRGMFCDFTALGRKRPGRKPGPRTLPASCSLSSRAAAESGETEVSTARRRRCC